MNTTTVLRKSWPYLAAILLFFLISTIYFYPVLEGKKLQSSDGVSFTGAAKEITDFRKETGKEALWTNSMFSGMPAYLISTLYPGELLAKIQKGMLAVSKPIMILTLSFTFFFVLCLLMDLSLWAAFAASLAYGFTTFTFVVMASGHMTKAHALVYMSLIVGGVLLAFRKNKIWGSIITAVGLSWMLSANHLQMTYYAAIMVIILSITYLIVAYKEKMLKEYGKTALFLIAAGIIAVGTNFSRLYTTYEYGKYSIRGGSDLSLNGENKTTGLDQNYILEYSYDWGEAMTAFIPRFKGGGMSEPVSKSSNSYKFLEETQGKSLADRFSSRMPMYWGSQPISGAPFYFGAVLCFLFVFGLFIVKGKDKWWLFAVFIISFLLSLGKNFSVLTNLMIDYFPGYNKFRDVKNIIVIQEFAMALMGALAIREVYLRKLNDQQFIKGLKYAVGITGGIALIFAVIPGLAGNFEGRSDVQYLQMGWPKELIDAIQLDRKAMLRTDAFRSLVFVCLAAAGLWAYWTKKLKAQYAVVVWSLLILIDMWPVNKKYFNKENFASKSEVVEPFKKQLADREIDKDTDLYFRVLNLNNPFNDARTSYFHKSIGGYHGAKMKKYNELIKYSIEPEMRQLTEGLNNQLSASAEFESNLPQPKTLNIEDVASITAKLPVINMLNTKYFIYDEEKPPIPNPSALGNVWLVNSVKIVDNADQEISACNQFDPKSEAIVNRKFAGLIDQQNFQPQESTIKLIEYQPNQLKYECNLSGKQLAVFSDIYYPKGWKAYIDGKESNYFCADYVLRAMILPEGKHEIEFEFKPSSYFTGNKIAFASSLLLLLAIAGLGYYEFKKVRKTHEA